MKKSEWLFFYFFSPYHYAKQGGGSVAGFPTDVRLVHPCLLGFLCSWFLSNEFGFMKMELEDFLMRSTGKLG